MANVNGFSPAAWSIDGALHPANLNRVLAYLSAGGREGVAAPGDCKVRPLATPGMGVRIDAGAVVYLNRSSNTRNQAYVADGGAQSTLDIKPTGSTKRSDLIVVRAKDPQFSPWTKPAPANAPTFQYVEPIVIENVPESTTTFAQLNLGYSGYAFARIDLPPNTTTAVQESMIKNLRYLANAGQSSDVVMAMMSNGQNVTNDWTFADWPVGLDTRVWVPYWATHFGLVTTISGFGIVGDALGSLRTFLGDVYGPPRDFDWNGSTVNGMRGHEIMYAHGSCAHLAGTNALLKTQAHRNPNVSTPGSGYIGSRSWGQIIHQIYFYQRTV